MRKVMEGFRLEARTSSEGRELVAELDLAAPPDAVWRALTEARELTNWFPLEAEVVPGEGGGIDISWEGEWASRLEIRTWEPGRHLRTTWPWAAEDGRLGEDNQVVLDFHLAAVEGGGTRLRMVHSGYPLGDEWDGIFDGTRRGWSYELRSLQHYLAHHQGVRRRVARVRRPMAGVGADEVWERLWSPRGLVAEGAMAPFEEGSRYQITMPGGIRLAGRILVAIPPTDLGVTVRGVKNSLFRVAIEHSSGPDAPLEVQLWLATWGALREQVAAIEAAWEEALDRIL